MDDENIIALYWQRSEDAIRETGLKYGSYCRSIALRILGDAESSEECVNDTWLHVWNAIPPQKPVVFRTYLGTITRHLCLNRVRDLSRQRRGGGQAVLALDELADCVPDAASPEKTLEDREITEALNGWLASLSVEKRVAFLRRYWYCDTLSGVAAFMGWPEHKTNSLLRRLRVGLKRHLEQKGVLL